MEYVFQLSNPVEATVEARDLNREDLLRLFQLLSRRLRATNNGQPITVIVHGGAVFVCHFRTRRSTHDVDYFSRRVHSLYGPGAVIGLRAAIDRVAVEESLPSSWMNSDADALIPVEYTNRLQIVDSASLAAEAQNTVLYQDRGLKVLASSWPWAFANKLDRYQKHDPMDTASLLWELGLASKDDRWLWRWVEQNCQAWVREWTDREMIRVIKRRIGLVTERLKRWIENGAPIPEIFEDSGSEATDEDSSDSEGYGDSD